MPFAIATIFNIDIKKLMTGQVEFETDAPEDFIIGKLDENKRNCEIVRYATDQIMFDPRPDVLPGILKKLELNERTFQRIFKKFVGVTPSNYRRICQFQQSFTQLRSNDFETMAAVAYENGFADQSHFIRSFKEFAETTPEHYVRSGLKKKE